MPGFGWFMPSIYQGNPSIFQKATYEHGLTSTLEGGKADLLKLRVCWSIEQALFGLSPPARCPCSHPFFGWEGSPTKIDVLKKNRVPLF